MHSLAELIEAADAGELGGEHAHDVARWLHWADVHYPLMAGIRAIAELEYPDPATPMAEVR